MKWKLLIIGLLVTVVLISGCIKIPIEEGDVIVKTDKIEYMQGENVSITIKNNMNYQLDFRYIRIERFIENNLEIVNYEIRLLREIRCNFSILFSAEAIKITLKPGEIYNTIWDQTICDGDAIGKFKVSLDTGWDVHYDSNEFIIIGCLTDSDCENLNCPLVGKPNLKPECVNDTCECNYSWCTPACR